jgi:hypothetical protein
VKSRFVLIAISSFEQHGYEKAPRSLDASWVPSVPSGDQRLSI